MTVTLIDCHTFMIDNDCMLREKVSYGMHTSICVSTTCAISETSGTNLSMLISQLNVRILLKLEYMQIMDVDSKYS